MSISLESLMPDTSVEATGSTVGGQLLAFIMVGGLGALGFMALSSVVLTLDQQGPRWLLSTLCYAAMIVPVYLAHRRFSFQSEAPHSRALPRYVAVQCSALLLAALFSWVAYGVFAVPPPLASMLVVGLTSGVNFMVLRLWAFAHH